jgi:phenylalanyl-tRNA synthetase alpha chain
VSATTDQLAGLEREAETALAAAGSVQALTEARARFLGRKGALTAVLRGLGALAPAERARAGEAANATKTRIEALAEVRRAALEEAERSRAMSERRLDVTLPGAAPPRGRLHPVTLLEREMCGFFRELGYSIVEGPEVDTDWNNFGALNFPDDHPARDTQDTFFVRGGHVLRTHTSSVQVRAMSQRQPPFRLVIPGRVYRNDLDATHYPMFHQIEGICVGERVSFGDLKGTLFAFARHQFGAEAKLRFRAHYFPFTEPSAEMDFWWEDRWLEWGGCGMIHPHVLRNCGIDPERWQGFAFGMGIDRAALDRYGIPSLGLLFEGDARVMELGP